MLATSMAYKRLKYFHKISSLELIEKIKTSVEKREEQIIHKRRKYKWLINMWESPLSKLQWNQNKDTSFLYQINKDSKKWEYNSMAGVG